MARVNGEAITLRELRERLDDLPDQRPPEQVLRELIKEHLLLQKAREMGLHPPHSILDLMAEEIQGKAPFQSDLSKRELEDRLAKLWLLGKVAEKLCPPPPITDTEARRYYQSHKGEYKIPERVIARQIVVASEEKAREVLKALESKKARFQDMAKRYSIGPEGERGGLLDPIYKGEEPPGFHILFTMKEGQLSPIVRSPYGYHIFKLEKRERSKVLPFSQVKDAIKRRLQSARTKECLDKWLASAMRKGKIEVYKEKLSLLEDKQ